MQKIGQTGERINLSGRAHNEVVLSDDCIPGGIGSSWGRLWMGLVRCLWSDSGAGMEEAEIDSGLTETH